MDSRPILKAIKKVAPSPPSIGSSSLSSTSKKLRPPPPPSIGSGSVASVSSSGAGSKRGSETSHHSGRSGSVKKSRSAHYPESESDDEPDITPENRLKLIREQGRILWIKVNRVNWSLEYNNLILGRKIDNPEPENYVYTTFCRSDLLQKIMDLKYKIRSGGSEKFFELRAKLNSFVGMEGIIFHNPEAIRMANIDALMGYQLSNPKNGRGESLILPNELLYFVDIYGAPGGAAEYFLWKKQWNAHGFGFTSKNMDYDLPVKPHYSAESFEAVYGFHGRKGQGDIYNPDEVDFFMKYVRKSTNFVGAHVCIAQGGEISVGDEDRKELRAKYLIMSEFMIALDVLREGGHFVCKIYDMFTSFTVGLIYLMYRTFDSVAIFKPETCLPASSDRYILCKYRKANHSILQIRRFLMTCLTSYCYSQKSGHRDEMADIIELVPFDAIHQSYSFYEHILSANAALGDLQIKQTEEIVKNIRIEYSYLKNRLAEIRKKALSIWGIPEHFKLNAKYTEASTPDLRASKLVRPYPPDVLLQIERDGEQILGFSNMEDELTHPKEWHFLPVGRDRGFFLSLGGMKVYRYSGSGSKWEEIPEKIEMCNNTLVYGDIIEEITIYEDKQIITSGLNIIDGILLGGKDIRGLPYVERNELCQKFARSMNKANRDDLSAIRCRKPRELLDIPRCLAMIKSERLKGGGKGPSKQAIYPVDDGETHYRRPRAPCVFKPLGFSLFKTSKGGGVQGDFLYTLQNRLYWRFTEDVNLDPAFDDWKKDADEKYGPIHAATLIDYLKAQFKK